jgi:hypothetical protein
MKPTTPLATFSSGAKLMTAEQNMATDRSANKIRSKETMSAAALAATAPIPKSALAKKPAGANSKPAADD